MKAALISLFAAGAVLTACVAPEAEAPPPTPAVARQAQKDVSEGFALFDSICLRAVREGNPAAAKDLGIARGFKKRGDVFVMDGNKSYPVYSKPGTRQNLVFASSKKFSIQCGVEWKTTREVAAVSIQGLSRQMHLIQGKEPGFSSGAGPGIEINGKHWIWGQDYNPEQQRQMIYIYD